MRRKGQIQMMETIAVLLIFMILVALGLIFFSRMMKTGAFDKALEFQDLDSIQIAQIASALPELQCSQDNILKTNCIDLLKLRVVTENPDMISATSYYHLFGFSSIRVIKVFPMPLAGENEPEWELYNKRPEVTRAEVPTYFPISLYNATNDLYYFGYMNVTTYIRE